MKIWLIILIGAVAGPLVGVPLTRYLWSSSPDCPIVLYPVLWLTDILADIFMPGQDYAGLVTFFPALALYCAAVGVLVALTCRFLWRKLSV